MEIDQREKLAKKIYDAAKSAHTKLLVFLSKRDDEDFNRHKYAFKVRAKSQNGLIEKALRKKTENPSYEIYKITDPLGLRVVSLFRQDLPYYLDKILGYFGDAGEELEENPFVFDSIKEIIIYTNDKNSADVKKLKAIIQLHKIDFVDSENIITTKQEYSSIHIVGKVNERVVTRLIPVPEEYENYDLPVEIQLRTIFEDAWGEIDHLLKYKSETEAEILSSKFLSSHIVSLKKFTDACANYADLINNESMKGSKQSHMPQIYSSMENEVAFYKDLDESNIEENVKIFINECRSQHKQLREKVKTIDSEGGNDHGMKNRLVDELKKLSDGIYDFCKSQKVKLCELSKFHLLMEEAHIRLNIRTNSQLIKALNLYNYVERDCRNKSAVYFRKGLAYSALEMFKEAEKVFLKSKELAVNEGDDSDTTKKFILNTLPIHLGLNYFNTSRKEEGENEVELLIKSIDVTYEGLGENPEEENETSRVLIINNNVLYYITRLAEAYEDRMNAKYSEIRDNSLSFLQSMIDSNETRSIRHIDTLAYALKLNGNLELAHKYATQAIHIIQEKHASGNMLTSEDIDIWVSNDDIIKTEI